MKKYKIYCDFDTMHQLLALFLCSLPGCLLWLVFGVAQGKRLFFYLLCGFAVLFLVCGIDFLYSYLSAGHSLFLDGEEIWIERNSNLTERMRISDVRGILFDPGRVMGYRARIRFSVILMDDKGRRGLVINDPSLVFVRDLMKKCKNARLSFLNYKKYIVVGAFFAVFCGICAFF